MCLGIPGRLASFHERHEHLARVDVSGVVDHGACDGMYVATSGVGMVPAGRELSADKAQRRRRALFGDDWRPRHGGHAGPG